MVTGMGAREQPLLAIITTAGTDISSPCYEKRGQMIRVLNGVIEDDSVFAIIFGLDKDDDWTLPDSLVKANPNIGVSVSKDFLEIQQRKAVQDASKQNIFKIKHCNQWVNAKETWLNYESWTKCHDPDFTIDDLINDPCYISVDLATKIDIAARINVHTRLQYVKGKEERHYYIIVHFYLPLETVQEKENKHYQGWYNDDLLTVNEGGELDYDMISEEIRGDLSECQVEEVVFDPWRAAHVIHQLQNEGAECVEFRNTPKNLTEAMREVEGAIKSRRIHHQNNPIMNWMVSNAIKRNLPNELTSIDKEKPRNKIDGVTGMVMGIGRAMYGDANNARSIYEDTEL